MKKAWCVILSIIIFVLNINLTFLCFAGDNEFNTYDDLAQINIDESEIKFAELFFEKFDDVEKNCFIYM